MNKPAIKIDQEIVGYDVVKEQPPAPLPAVHERPAKVLGATYKIKPPTINAALYITINHIELEDGSQRPIEVFLNTKDTTHSQWMHALTRLLSAQFRSPLPFEFAIQELKEVVDPKGSYFIPGGGGQCGGLVDHIARVIEAHCIDIGAITRPEMDKQQRAELDEKAAAAAAKGIKGQECPKCHEKTLVQMDGCLTCTSCGESKCG